MDSLNFIYLMDPQDYLIESRKGLGDLEGPQRESETHSSPTNHSLDGVCLSSLEEVTPCRGGGVSSLIRIQSMSSHSETLPLYQRLRS